MTCLTVTPASADEAVAEKADLIVTHHPLPFRPLKRLTTDSTPGRLLLQLIRADVAVFSPHTAFDSAAAGINQQLAEGLGLSDLAPLIAKTDQMPVLGAGRFGNLQEPLALPELAARLKAFLGLSGLHVVGDAAATTPPRGRGLRGGWRIPGARPASGLRYLGDRRNQLPHLPGSGSARHRTAAARAFRQRTFCRRDPGHQARRTIPRPGRLGQPARAGPIAMGVAERGSITSRNGNVFRRTRAQRQTDLPCPPRRAESGSIPSHAFSRG